VYGRIGMLSLSLVCTSHTGGIDGALSLKFRTGHTYYVWCCSSQV